MGCRAPLLLGLVECVVWKALRSEVHCATAERTKLDDMRHAFHDDHACFYALLLYIPGDK